MTDQCQYISWVPNISGRLIFSLVDAYDYRNDRIVGDVFECREKRQQESVLEKDLLDPLLISMLVDLKDSMQQARSGYTRVVFLAKPSDDGSLLIGKIGFFDDLKQPMLYKSDDENKIIRTLSEQTSYNAWEQSFSSLKALYNDAKETKVYTVIDFELEQNGIIRLELTDSLKGLSQKQIRADVLQAYFFIKFVFHKDRFHDKANEYIIPLLPFDPQYDLTHYCNQIIDTMKQYVLSYRKEHDQNYMDLQSLKGVLTYATALTKELDKDHADNQKVALSAIEKSLDLEIARLRPRNLPNLMDFLDDLKNWVVVVFAVITPFIIKSNHKYTRFWDYLSHDAMVYYGIGLGTIIAFVFLLRVMHDLRNRGSMKTCYLTKTMLDLSQFISLVIKKCSRPSLALWNPFTRFVCPFFVYIEMDISRKGNTTKIILVLIVYVLLIFTWIAALDRIKDKYIPAEQSQPPQIPYKPKHPSIVDINKTLRSAVTR